MSEAKDKFEIWIDEWLKDAPLLPGFRDFFVQRVQKKCIEWLVEVHENSVQLYKSNERRIALPEDIFNAIKILKIKCFSEDIEVFYEHYYKPLIDETPEKSEVKALYEHYVRHKDAIEYINELDIGEAEERATWKKKFLQDIYLDFPPAVGTPKFIVFNDERRMKSEDTAQFLEDASFTSINTVRRFMSKLPPNIQGLQDFQSFMVKSTKDLLEAMHAKSLSLQVPEMTLEQRKLLNEACDNMIAEFTVERGFDGIADLSHEDIQSFENFSSVTDTRKRRKLDLNATPVEFDLNESPDGEL